MKYEKVFWRDTVFKYASYAAALFVILTLMAMHFYPGGTAADPAAQGYSFFNNYFSDLGALHTLSGASNLISASLFIPALVLAGLSIIFFGLAFPQFFNQPGAGQTPARYSVLFSIITGICFIGTALTPVDVLFNAHLHLSQWGFRFFMISAFFWAIAIFYHEKYPKRYAWILIGFGVLLIGFILLMSFGPPPSETESANTIMATSQKIIVYAAIITVLIEAQGARAMNRG